MFLCSYSLSYVFTLQKLMPDNVLSEDFLSGVKSIDYKSVTTSPVIDI